MVNVKLGDFVNIKTGKLNANASTSEGKYPFFTCGKETLKIDTYSFDEECVLLAGNGDFSTKYYKGKFDAYQRTYIITPKDDSVVNCKYIYYIITNKIDELKSLGQGSVIKYLKLNQIQNIVFNLPPIEKQEEIVAILDQVYENIGFDIEGKISDLKALKKSAIDKAIRGLLTSQNDCESAEELYQSIQQEKERLIKEGKIKKSKKEEIKPITEEAFEIPNNWKWVRLGEIADIVMGQSPKGNELNENNIGMEFHQGKSNFGYKFIEKSNVCTNNILKIAKSNSILLSVRAPVGVLNITNREICLGRGLCGIFSIKSNQNFLWYSLNKMNELLIKKGVGTIFDSVTSEDVRNLPIPLPPLEEQERIVEILSAIDSAIDSAIEVQEDNLRLLNSLLNKFLCS